MSLIFCSHDTSDDISDDNDGTDEQGTRFYKDRYLSLKLKCQEIQERNERVLRRVSAVRKLVRRMTRDNKCLAKRLERHDSKWRSTRVAPPWASPLKNADTKDEKGVSLNKCYDQESFSEMPVTISQNKFSSETFTNATATLTQSSTVHESLPSEFSNSTITTASNFDLPNFFPAKITQDTQADPSAIPFASINNLLPFPDSHFSSANIESEGCLSGSLVVPDSQSLTPTMNIISFSSAQPSTTFSSLAKDSTLTSNVQVFPSSLNPFPSSTLPIRMAVSPQLASQISVLPSNQSLLSSNLISSPSSLLMPTLKLSTFQQTKFINFFSTSLPATMSSLLPPPVVKTGLKFADFKTAQFNQRNVGETAPIFSTLISTSDTKL